MKPNPDTLLATLRRLNPARVRAYASDDDARDIAVPTRRRRWEQVISAIQGRAWVRVEMLDKSGAVLGQVENADAAREVEELAPAAGSHGGQLLLAERIVGLVLKGQREAMQFRDAEVTALLRAQGDVVREMSMGMRTLGELYREQGTTAEQTAELRATAAAEAGGDDSQVKQLLEAFPTLLQLGPLARSLMAGPAAPTTKG